MKLHLFVFYIMLICGSSLRAEDCSSYRDRRDREDCRREEDLRKERETERQQQKDDEQQQKAQAFKEKTDRLRFYKFLINSYLLNGNSDKGGFTIEVDDDERWPHCKQMYEEIVENYADQFSATKQVGNTNAFTTSDLRALTFNILLSPRSDGELFPDGTPLKSTLNQLDDYLLMNNDVGLWTERYRQLNTIKTKVDSSLAQIGTAPNNPEKWLPATDEERDSYKVRLARLSNALGNAAGTGWYTIDKKWAEDFMNQQEADYNNRSGRRSMSFCDYYKSRFVNPYLSPIAGMDDTNRMYLQYLQAMTHAAKCSTGGQDGDIIKKRSAAAFSTYVNDVIVSNNMTFTKMVIRQKMIGNLGLWESQKEFFGSLTVIQNCVNEQMDRINAMKPITSNK